MFQNGLSRWETNSSAERKEPALVRIVHMSQLGLDTQRGILFNISQVKTQIPKGGF